VFSDSSPVIHVSACRLPSSASLRLMGTLGALLTRLCAEFADGERQTPKIFVSAL
jgi:hypothetical protein